MLYYSEEVGRVDYNNRFRNNMSCKSVKTWPGEQACRQVEFAILKSAFNLSRGIYVISGVAGDRQ